MEYAAASKPVAFGREGSTPFGATMQGRLMVGQQSLKLFGEGSTPSPATMRDQLVVGCLPLKQVTKVRILLSQPASEPGRSTGLQTRKRGFNSLQVRQTS